MEKDIKIAAKRPKAQTYDDLDDRWVESPEAVAAVEAMHSKKMREPVTKVKMGTTKTNMHTKVVKRNLFGNDRRSPLLAELRNKISSLKEANDNLKVQKGMVENYKDIVNDKIKQLEQKQDEIDTLTTKNNKLCQAIVKIKETMNENIDAAEIFCDTTKNCIQQFKELNIGRFELLMNELIDDFPHN